MVNMGTLPKSPVPLALLAHVFISPEYCLSQIVPSFIVIIHRQSKRKSTAVMDFLESGFLSMEKDCTWGFSPIHNITF